MDSILTNTLLPDISRVAQTLVCMSAPQGTPRPTGMPESRVAQTSGFEVCGFSTTCRRTADHKTGGPRYLLRQMMRLRRNCFPSITVSAVLTVGFSQSRDLLHAMEHLPENSPRSEQH